MPNVANFALFGNKQQLEEEAKAHTSHVAVDWTPWEKGPAQVSHSQLICSSHRLALSHQQILGGGGEVVVEGKSGRKPLAETGSVYLTF